MSKKLKIGLCLFLLLQILVSAGFELAHDEAYYWLYSRHLAWGYFDHPPMVGLTIALFSFLPHGEWTLRLGFILQQLAALLLLINLVPARSANIATMLFLAFPLASFSGLLALPDMPLLFMTAVYCWLLREYLEKESTRSTWGLALAIPLLLYSKYHGILLIFFTILAVPRLLLRKSFYLITIIAILFFLPHVWWQYQHDFSTLRYHFLERPKSAFSLKRILDYVGVQVALAGVLAGPLVWWSAARFKSLNNFDRAMKFISFGVVIFFLISTFSKKFEANWTIFLAIPLIYLAAQSELFEKRWSKVVVITSLVIVLAARLILVIPFSHNPVKRLAEFKGWRNWSQEMQKKCGGNKHLVANSYQIASKLSYYLQQEIPALNYHSRKNQFDYWQFEKKINGQEICYLTDKQEFSGENVQTPEGKTLMLVKGKSVPELWAMKAEQTSL